MQTNLIQSTMALDDLSPRPSCGNRQTMTAWAQGGHLGLRCREDPWGLPIKYGQQVGAQPQRTSIN